jgi:glycerol-3-phosphate acyltransferase PlsY
VQVIAYLVIALAAYLLGSIPTGFLVAQAKGIDIRTVGSGNIGATNAFRVLGKTAGTAVLITDGLKGYAACAWLCDPLLRLLQVPVADAETYRVIAGIAAVLGHNYTCWLWFKGGKGIATTAGVYFALEPWSVVIAIVAWIIVLLGTRYVSVASLAAAVALPTAVALRQPNLTLTGITVVIGALAIFKHKANIQRLLAGTENRVQFKKKGDAK